MNDKKGTELAYERHLKRLADAYWANPTYTCEDCGAESGKARDWYQDSDDLWHCVACQVADARGVFL